MNTTLRSTTLGFLVLLGLLLTIPSSAGDHQGPKIPLFETSDRCVACHNGLATPTGDDASIGFAWTATMMGNAARDPYWQAAIRRETLEHPEASAEIQDECSKCHMPMQRYEAHTQGTHGEIFSHLPIGQSTSRVSKLSADGVSCTLCHQILADNLNDPSSLVGGFLVDEKTPIGERNIYGPYEIDEGRTRIMSSSSRFAPRQGAHMQDAALCGGCHTLFTNSLGPNGEVIGRLPEQTPFLEWQASSVSDSQSCQSCHMPTVEGKMPISSVWGEPREQVSQHAFRGGNFLIPRLLNRHRGDLGTVAQPQELSRGANGTVDHLKSSSARLFLDGTVVEGIVSTSVRIENLAGHKLPTAYPSRRAWIHFVLRDGSGKTLFESGALKEDGSIEGNDNDIDPARYEPHYTSIGSVDQVQIYEAILGGLDAQVTTGLLTATQYLKDNRILPPGFNKDAVETDIAVYGDAFADADFIGGSETVEYRVDTQGAKGPYTAEVSLLYQPIGYRWATNLAEFDAVEPQRFVGYFAAAAHESAVALSSQTSVIELPVVPPPCPAIEAPEAVPANGDAPLN